MGRKKERFHCNVAYTLYNTDTHVPVLFSLFSKKQHNNTSSWTSPPNIRTIVGTECVTHCEKMALKISIYCSKAFSRACNHSYDKRNDRIIILIGNMTSVLDGMKFAIVDGAREILWALLSISGESSVNEEHILFLISWRIYLMNFFYI